MMFRVWQKHIFLKGQGISQHSLMVNLETILLFHENQKNVFFKIHEVQGFVENLSEKKMQILWNNNEGEYMSNEFHKYLKEHEIWHK